MSIIGKGVKYIKEQALTQEQAAKFFNETELQISNLMNGDLERFSIEQLVTMIFQAGMQIKIEVTSRVA